MTSESPLKNAIALLGGSFNPVHNGHVALAEKIQELCGFETLWIVPNKAAPHKALFTVETSHRLKMTELAFEAVPNAKISTFEIESKEPNYAIFTIKNFRRTEKDRPVYFILGADAFSDLPDWYAFPEVLEMCSYIVVRREGWGRDGRLNDCIAELFEENLVSEDKPFGPFKRVLKTSAATQICFLDTTLPEVSSTEVRMRLQLGQTVAGLVPNTVERYLKSHNLYGTQVL